MEDAVLPLDWSAASRDVLREISKRLISCFRFVCNSWRSFPPLFGTKNTPLNLMEDAVLPPDWSAAPRDVLREISKRLISWDDYVCFRFVCNSWRSAAHRRPKLPLVLVRQTTSDEFYSLKLSNCWDAELYSPPLLPDEIIRGQYICGSSLGWIAFHEKDLPILHLHNPFTGVHICLPAMPDSYYPSKVILSSDPVIDPDNCAILALTLNHGIFGCRLGDASWTRTLFAGSIMYCVEDIVYYRGKFYAVSDYDGLFVCQTGSDLGQMIEILPANPLFSDHPIRQWHKNKHYAEDEVFDIGFCLTEGAGTNLDTRKLVVSSSDLLLVTIRYDSPPYKICGCDVFRVQVDGDRFKLFVLENLDGFALFLGVNTTGLSLSVDNTYPIWCKRNCIYFLDYKMTVFNLEDRRVSLQNSKYLDEKIWLTPTIRW